MNKKQKYIKNLLIVASKLLDSAEAKKPARRSKSARRSKVAKIDEDALRDLELTMENDASLQNQLHSIVKNIMRRLKKGTYDPAKAPKLWGYLIESGIRSYAKQGKIPVKQALRDMFPVPLRKELAKRMAVEYLESIKAGDYDFVMEK